MAQATQQAAPAPGERRYVGGGTNADNAVVCEAIDVRAYDTFELSCTAGVFDVYVDADGSGTYLASPRSLADLGAQDLVPVIEGAAGKVYGFRGAPFSVKVLQKGATAVVGFTLACKRLGAN